MQLMNNKKLEARLLDDVDAETLIETIRNI